MITDDELRDLIALGEKATARPWAKRYNEFSHNHKVLATFYTSLESFDAGSNTDYVEAAANLAPDIAAELIAARELPAKITEISELASEMWYRLVIIANDINNWEVYLEFVDPSDEGIEGESISVYADTMIAAIDKAIRRLKCGDL